MTIRNGNSGRIARSISAAFVFVLTIAHARAEGLDVSVIDSSGNPVPNVAVFVDSETPPAAPATSARATMDQVDTRFVPHLLVVQAGTSVDFPNSDTVAHHVYSFSKPNAFILPLYKGDVHPPVKFEHAGIVTLGCNIHDDMLAYVLVVDSESFAITDSYGKARLDVVDAGNSEIRIWSPRLRDEDVTQAKALNPDGNQDVTFALTQTLRDAHDLSSTALAWKAY